MTTIGEALVRQLALRGVEHVFGIPGVHTIELYRGLVGSGLRHITPRHEQGAGFMADGYARATGKPGVAFVITGPGLTNTLTAMAQARADSVPMLVISSVNKMPSLGEGLGYLHELPDQLGLSRKVSLEAMRIESATDVLPALDRAFEIFGNARPGPVHIELPMDVATLPFNDQLPAPIDAQKKPSDPDLLAQAAEVLRSASRPVILAGGGARFATASLKSLAERLDAPVVQTVNARGVMHAHALSVPASPSLQAVRALIEDADAVLAIGTELGPTDFDMYDTGSMPKMQNLIRIDICPNQLNRHHAKLSILGDAPTCLNSLLELQETPAKQANGAARATAARDEAFAEIGPEMRKISETLAALRDALPNALFVGDSTQPIYAGNLYYDHDRIGGWFNAATGYGALGYGIPAAIGASIGTPGVTVVCLVGDGGAQFSLPEIMAAVDEKLPILFVIWNSNGYQEIDATMRAADVDVVGCDPTPPDFSAVAKSFGIPFKRTTPDAKAVATAIASMNVSRGPAMIEIEAPYVP